MRHVRLIIEENFAGRWRLVDSEEAPIAAFDAFSASMAPKHPQNTRKAYCQSVALFIDYLIEASLVLKVENGSWPKEALRIAVDAYPEWLSRGEESSEDFSSRMAKALPSPKSSASGVTVALSGVKKFLTLSEKFRQAQADQDYLKSLEGPGSESPAQPAEKDLWQKRGRRPLARNQTRAMRANSLLGGVIAGGPKLTSGWEAPISTKSTPEFDAELSFPFDQVPQLLAAFTKPRDKALYALCAASGCRVHEALQILWSDIDFKNRTVALVDPKSRPASSSYAALLPHEREQLAWKGRSSSHTLLLQPFCDLFFKYLEEYLKGEFVPHGKHDFVFQYSAPSEPGRPFFLAAQEGRHQTFKLAVDKLGLSSPISYGVHSLRHMYGSYLVNYFPAANGKRGLPMEIVQKLMGHASLKSTQRYAKHDTEVLAAELQAAFLSAIENGGASLLEMKREALKKSLEEIDKKIFQEKSSQGRVS